MTALLLLIAVGMLAVVAVVVWGRRALARVERELRSFDGIEGIHLGV